MKKVEKKYVSVTPLRLDLTDENELKKQLGGTDF